MSGLSHLGSKGGVSGVVLSSPWSFPILGPLLLLAWLRRSPVSHVAELRALRCPAECCLQGLLTQLPCAVLERVVVFGAFWTAAPGIAASPRAPHVQAPPSGCTGPGLTSSFPEDRMLPGFSHCLVSFFRIPTIWRSACLKLYSCQTCEQSAA